MFIVIYALVWCSLLYGAEDTSAAGIVLNSVFSNLYGLMMELADDSVCLSVPHHPSLSHTSFDSDMVISYFLCFS